MFGKIRKFFGMKKKRKYADGDLENQVFDFWGDYWCGCGDPEEAMRAFREVLEMFVEREDGDFKSVMIDLEKMKVYEAKHGEGLVQLILYWFSGMGLSEHGGSVYGSWLTDLGKEIWLDVMTSDKPGPLRDDD